MQIIIEIKDSKADFVLDWLKQHSYVKIKSIIDKKGEKAQFIKELQEAVDFMREVEAGRVEGTPAKDLLDIF